MSAAWRAVRVGACTSRSLGYLGVVMTEGP